jgi:hypothetical protein
MATTWITSAGNLGILQERVSVNILLEATSDTGPISYSVISGRLPAGLFLNGSTITGTPAEVTKFTESKFVIRADDGSKQGMDRTFSLSVDGSDFPEWLTEEGFLNVGFGQAYFILDDAKVDFQLEATDTDVVAGDVLEYYVVPNSGKLPPGLTLSRTGRIVGFTQPIPAIDYNDTVTGAYDTHSFDTVPLDIAKNTSLGFDSFFYDNNTYDYGETSRIPKKISRIYTFGVAVTDGVNAVNRIFKIYVVSEEFLKADNSLVQVDTNLFQADATSDRVPLWITDSYLGRKRANNYLTLYLEVYDPPTLTGTITYLFVDTNDDGSPSILPPGLVLDTVTGELAGRVPYQNAVTKPYRFTIKAVNFPNSLAQASYTLVGDWTSTRVYQVNEAVRFQGFIYVCKQAHINQIPNEISDYWVFGVGTADKTFTIDIVGDIESAIEWISPSDRGTIKPNQPSKIYVEAKTLLYGGRLSYTLKSGTLPPGLEFLPNGLIQGKIRQFADSDQDGLTRFYDQDSALIDSTNSRTYETTFDNTNTTFDKVFNFTVSAIDGANFASSDRDFTIKVIAEREITFCNVYAKALQPKNKRLEWFNFITDATIFSPNSLYRYGDNNFGVQAEIQALIFAGIESRSAVEFVQAMSRNHYNKRFTFGDLKSAKGRDPVTQETIYEVIYVDLIDDLEKNGESISPTIELSDTINSKILVSYDKIRVDSDIPFVSDSDLQRVFPNSVANMRDRIEQIGQRDREFLPLWMRSIQEDGSFELGFVKSMILCYANPGKSEEILAKIKASGFDFKSIDFVADRFVVDIIGGEIQDQYLKFPQRAVSLQNETKTNSSL